jgi:hypothetical protein
LEPAPSGEKREKPKSQHQAFEGNSQPKFYLSIIKSSTITGFPNCIKEGKEQLHNQVKKGNNS